MTVVVAFVMLRVFWLNTIPMISTQFTLSTIDIFSDAPVIALQSWRVCIAVFGYLCQSCLSYDNAWYDSVKFCDYDYFLHMQGGHEGMM